jgi:transaldolase
MNKIEIYYDGVDIKKHSENKHIKGFTTNISFLKDAGISDYDAFIKESLIYSKGKPISFQLYDDTDTDIEKTANKICSYDRKSIFVKIPIIKSNGDSNANIIKKLHNQGNKVNVTAIFTKEQIDSIKDCFSRETDVIVSIFAGRINDSGLDCSDVVKHAVDTFSTYKNVKILWAACRTIYNMFEAEKQGAHIVTAPDSVISRMSRIGDDSYEASLKQVQQFKKDGITGNIVFVEDPINNYEELKNMSNININNIPFKVEKNIKSITITDFKNNTKLIESYNEELNQKDIKIFFVFEYIWHSAFGHWFYESAIFLPFFNIIKKQYKNIKLLVNKNPIRDYKKLLFDFFDIKDEDIFYLEDQNYDYFNHTYYNNIPSNNISIICNTNTLNTPKNLNTNNYLDLFNIFLKEINDKIKLNNINYEEKTIKNLYLPKNKVQVYEPNQNAYDYNKIYNLLNNVDYIEYDTINTKNFLDQIKLLASAENIYVTYGSAFIVNALFCKNTTIYVSDFKGVDPTLISSIICDVIYKNNTIIEK